MADTRINAIATTATASASDDFLPIDGTTNGTRKLSAYSPTFGGNVLVGTTTDSGSRIQAKTNSNAYTGSGFSILDQNAGTTFITRANGTFYISNNGSTDHFVLNSSGNGTFAGNLTVSGTGASTFGGSLGVGGATPSAWDAAVFKLIQFPNGSAVGDIGGYASLSSNYYNNAGDKYIANGYATRYYTGGGDFVWNTAGSGTAGSALSFATAMTLKNSGNLLLGTTTDNALGKLQVNGASWLGGDVNIAANYVVKSADVLYLAGATGRGVTIRTNGTVDALTLDSSQRTILSGALRLANSYVATPQISTGYVTIQDSTGTTYKVLVAP